MGLSKAAIDPKVLEAEREGIWRLLPETIDGDEGIEFLVRYWESSGGQHELMKLLMRNQQLASGKDTDAQKFKLLMQKKATIATCLAGWRTVRLERTTNPEHPYIVAEVISEEVDWFGQMLPFNKANAEKVLLDERGRRLYDHLHAAANDDDAYSEHLADMAKNSDSSSDGN